MKGDIFEKAPRVDADNFYTDKKVVFSKISGYMSTWPKILQPRETRA